MSFSMIMETIKTWYSEIFRDGSTIGFQLTNSFNHIGMSSVMYSIIKLCIRHDKHNETTFCKLVL